MRRLHYNGGYNAILARHRDVFMNIPYPVLRYNVQLHSNIGRLQRK